MLLGLSKKNPTKQKQQPKNPHPQQIEKPFHTAELLLPVLLSDRFEFSSSVHKKMMQHSGSNQLQG